MADSEVLFKNADRSARLLTRIYSKRMNILHDFAKLKAGSLRSLFRQRKDTVETEADILRRLKSVNKAERRVMSILKDAASKALVELENRIPNDYLTDQGKGENDALHHELREMISKWWEMLPLEEDMLALEAQVIEHNDPKIFVDYIDHLRFYAKKMEAAVKTRHTLHDTKKFVSSVEKSIAEIEKMRTRKKPGELVSPSIVNGLIRVAGSTAGAVLLGESIPHDFGMFIVRVGTMSAIISFFDYYYHIASGLSDIILGTLAKSYSHLSDLKPANAKPARAWT
ncbi:MAG: hypothetical protein ABIA93_01530 [Candidatus Woesearchaeota archaeon]